MAAKRKRKRGAGCKTERFKGGKYKVCRTAKGTIKSRKKIGGKRKGGKKCKLGVNKNTGKCLKNRRKRK